MISCALHPALTMWPLLLLSLLLPGSVSSLSGPRPANTVNTTGPQHFKLGLLAPWNASFDDYSALTSASAVTIAIETIHADPTLKDKMQFRLAAQATG